jgi:hypothetical protein
MILGETVDGRFRPFCFSPHSFSQITKQLRCARVPRGCWAAGVGSGTRVGWWQAKKTKRRFFAQNAREEEAVLAALGMTGGGGLAALGMTGRRVFQKRSAYGTTEVVP